MAPSSTGGLFLLGTAVLGRVESAGGAVSPNMALGAFQNSLRMLLTPAPPQRVKVNSFVVPISGIRWLVR